MKVRLREGVVSKASRAKRNSGNPLRWQKRYALLPKIKFESALSL